MTATTFVLAAPALQLPDPLSRNLYTNNSTGNLTAGTNHVSTANLTSFTGADFGLTGATGEPTMAELIGWARGDDILDKNSTSTTRYVMGDPLHSQPASSRLWRHGGQP